MNKPLLWQSYCYRISLFKTDFSAERLIRSRDLANEGDEKSKKIFNSLHFQSVSININTNAIT